MRQKLLKRTNKDISSSIHSLAVSHSLSLTAPLPPPSLSLYLSLFLSLFPARSVVLSRSHTLTRAHTLQPVSTHTYMIYTWGKELTLPRIQTLSPPHPTSSPSFLLLWRPPGTQEFLLSSHQNTPRMYVQGCFHPLGTPPPLGGVTKGSSRRALIINALTTALSSLLGVVPRGPPQDPRTPHKGRCRGHLYSPK